MAKYLWIQVFIEDASTWERVLFVTLDKVYCVVGTGSGGVIVDIVKIRILLS
jgi:hypothetical protein